MSANFDRWEQDPFFSAAEEVQESADRMESTYRTWFHSSTDSANQWNLEEIRRELCTGLDTAKWQLEEFQRAVRNSYKNNGADEEEAKGRHRQFALAMEDKVCMIQQSLKESASLDGKKRSSPRVQLDEEECDELALFLSGPVDSRGGAEVRIEFKGKKGSNSMVSDVVSTSNCFGSGCYPAGQRELDAKDGRFSGLRRSASASADISSWNIAIREEESAMDLSSGPVEAIPRRAPSFSSLTGAMEPVPILKLPKNVFRKWKFVDRQEEEDAAFLRAQPQNRGSHSCYERNKSCLGTCEDCYDKQLYGWYGALYRLLQRSIYQVQYFRSIQLMFCAAILLFFMVLFLVRVF